MSADNGVYIIPVHFPSENKPSKFLVFYSAAIENCEFEADRPDGYNSSWIINFVLMRPDVKIAFSLEEAQKIANIEAKRYPFLEYGICLLSPIKLAY